MINEYGYRSWMILWLLIPILLCACGKSTEKEARIYRHGQNYLKRGDVDDALRCFLAVTQHSNRHAAEAHLECAEIFFAKKNDPLTAIYHYRAYLRHSPTNRQSNLVRQRIESAEKTYLSQIPLLRQATHETQADLLRTVKMLQDENGKLKRQQALLVGRVREMRAVQREEQSNRVQLVAESIPQSSPNQAIADSSMPTQHYTVQKGDTLSSISLKVYGKSSRWNEIFQANREQLPSPSKLKLGQQLLIP